MSKTTAFIPESQPSLTYSLTETPDGAEQLLVFSVTTSETISVRDDHPLYDEIREGVLNSSLSLDQVKAKVDMSTAVADSFRSVTDRVKVQNGRVFFDGDEIHNSLADHIIRCLEAGLEDYKPLVKFLENLAQNPTEHSREQLYEWLTRHDFTITQDGQFIAYKGVAENEDGNWVSVHSGPAIVNGVAVNGRVPNPAGAVVEIARSKVEFNPSVGCSSGLHAGTYSYAKQWAQGALLKVKINPRDVVSVPTDCGWQKIRVCRYLVLEQIDAPETRPVDTDCYCDGDGGFCTSCGEPLGADDNYCGECGESVSRHGDCGDCGCEDGHCDTDCSYGSYDDGYCECGAELELNAFYCSECGEPTDLMQRAH